MSNDGTFRPNAPELLKKGDLRDMREARCPECQHTWWAPVIGRCPKCRAEGAVEISSVMIGAPRV